MGTRSSDKAACFYQYPVGMAGETRWDHAAGLDELVVKSTGIEPAAIQASAFTPT
jgi:hypothetical protein